MTHKRQRTESGAAPPGDGCLAQRKRDEFLITFGNYGTISLSKAAIEAYPTSLLTVTLLGDGIDEHSLYVPVGRGLDSFPRLIKEIYDCGSIPEIPRKGVHFDLFVKWLRYLGLATSGRELSTESGASKRVSYFVETVLNTTPSFLLYERVGFACVCAIRRRAAHARSCPFRVRSSRYAFDRHSSLRCKEGACVEWFKGGDKCLPRLYAEVKSFK